MYAADLEDNFNLNVGARVNIGAASTEAKRYYVIDLGSYCRSKMGGSGRLGNRSKQVIC